MLVTSQHYINIIKKQGGKNKRKAAIISYKVTVETYGGKEKAGPGPLFSTLSS